MWKSVLIKSLYLSSWLLKAKMVPMLISYDVLSTGNFINWSNLCFVSFRHAAYITSNLLLLHAKLYFFFFFPIKKYSLTWVLSQITSTSNTGIFRVISVRHLKGSLSRRGIRLLRSCQCHLPMKQSLHFTTERFKSPHQIKKMLKFGV